MKKWLLILLASMFTLTACSPTNEPTGEQEQTNIKEVKLVLDWTPNTNHTGLYVARDKGYFKEEGLNVSIIQPGEAGAEQMVAAGQADFGVSYQEGVTQARTQNVPIVSIAAILQHNTSGFASLKEKNIETPKNFEGKVYGGFGSPVEEQMIASLMSEEQADVKKVQITPIGNVDFFTAIKKNIDFSWIYYGWTGIEAELRGQDLNMIYLTDYAKELDYYTPVIISNEKNIKENTETVAAFMKAVSRGYQFAIEQPQAAADILIQAEPDLNGELVKKSQEWLSPRYQADATQWGTQKEEIWTNYADWMRKHGVLEGKFDAKSAFTNQFLPEGGK
ncbi:ABC transporter substrate-binding protein [Hazenella sp. IB182357]|uniref:ABC transporter substrate-binding protein n=1 Tax=Polycladospora coralii TaxID=2771432 RepID=A0A926N6U6_9BACL|nr:ABC transporter substrate-binding protein [Polycladospora coralii]MBD1370791.1 ABC transporter substrate-binding protein [Polycladospora coralii]MBS7529730.1 ABC transporter substrate-binding protein [Polycladospora coralii]